MSQEGYLQTKVRDLKEELDNMENRFEDLKKIEQNAQETLKKIVKEREEMNRLCNLTLDVEKAKKQIIDDVVKRYHEYFKPTLNSAMRNQKNYVYNTLQKELRNVNDHVNKKNEERHEFMIAQLNSMLKELIAVTGFKFSGFKCHKSSQKCHKSSQRTYVVDRELLKTKAGENNLPSPTT